MQMTDYLAADRFSAPGGTPVLVVDAASWRRPVAAIQAVIVGIDREGRLPPVAEQDHDLLLTTRKAAPRPWVSLDPAQFDDVVQKITQAVHATPIAATIAAQVLRLSAGRALAEALQIESLAYSALLGGTEFKRWLDENHGDEPRPVAADALAIGRRQDKITLTLNDPGNRNAISAAMRDALYEALANMLDDPSKPDIILQGAGKCFSTGGSLAEFGTAQDLAEAHLVRSLHSCALALDALGERANVLLHGACVGSGIEIAAAAHRRIASANAWFQLPEMGMGLIPGAGGTATVARAIGRHRTLWMLLSARRINARQALDWGLVHAIEKRS